MVALPLQGLAAVSMMLCAPASAAAAGGHLHDADPDTGHAHDHADHATAHHADASHAAADASGEHPCGVCGAGCHTAALPNSQVALADTAPPQSRVTEPPRQLGSRDTPVPDKPPRA